MMANKVLVSEANRNKNRWRRDKHYSSMKVLQMLMQVFALNCIERRITINEERCSIIRKVMVAIFLGALNFYTLYYKIRYIFDEVNLSVKASDTVQMTFDYCQFIVDLYIVNKYGNQIYLEYLKQYECIDRILDIKHLSEIHRRLTWLLIIFGLIWFTTSTLEFVGWYLSFVWWIPVVYGVAYIFLLIKILTILDMTTQVIQIKYRLQVMADFMQSYYNSADCMLTATTYSNDLLNDILCNKNWFYCDDYIRAQKIKRGSFRLKTLSSNIQQEVKWLSRCYLMLTEQCVFINNMFGVRILLSALSLLIDMVRYANVSIRILTAKQSTQYDAGYIPVVTNFLRLLPCASIMFSLVHHCEQTYRQKDRILGVIQHTLFNKNPSEELKSAVIEFRELIQLQPISFNTATFFKLDYRFWLSMASVVVTYSIILIQNL